MEKIIETHPNPIMNPNNLSSINISEVFCVIDEFCKEYDQIVDKSLLGNPAKRPPTMSVRE
ncbi:hypothetical protein GCM10007384_20720 [Aquimarina muelleri]|uniref:Uncharacterized protein n=1 Tax=Aquimarina muelleri TaxID=279356 RepID=A0A918JV91_9FLAO|nr:hypothetical protein GCM10007384_20720 [Aquimarina muelleri]